MAEWQLYCVWLIQCFRAYPATLGRANAAESSMFGGSQFAMRVVFLNSVGAETRVSFRFSPSFRLSMRWKRVTKSSLMRGWWSLVRINGIASPHERVIKNSMKFCERWVLNHNQLIILSCTDFLPSRWQTNKFQVNNEWRYWRISIRKFLN